MRKAAVSGLLLAAGCLSINVYLNFPALEKALLQMEKDVRKGADETPPPPQKMAQDDIVPMQGPDINLETPAIRKIKKSRADRFAEVAALLDKGAVGEGQDCTLQVRGQVMDALPARDRQAARKLVEEENKDRNQLIVEIMRANDLSGGDAENQVRERYFRVLRRLARVGWHVEYEAGKLRPKTAEDQKRDERE
jgi:hypothetical protein